MEVTSRAPTGLEVAKLLVSRCQICKRNDSNSAIVPCGHIAGCEKCLKNCAITKCPLCKEDKKDVQRVYQSGDSEMIGRASLNKLRISGKTQDYKCTICLANESNIAIRPCGHICGCKECLDTYTITTCPICRTNKTGILKILQLKETPPSVPTSPKKPKQPVTQRRDLPIDLNNVKTQYHDGNVLNINFE